MFDPKILDDIANKLGASLPQGMQSLQQDFEKNVRATLQTALNKLDLVTRDEFEVQSQVLAKTRAKLDALETRVTQLEQQMNPQKPSE